MIKIKPTIWVIGMATMCFLNTTVQAETFNQHSSKQQLIKALEGKWMGCLNFGEVPNNHPQKAQVASLGQLLQLMGMNLNEMSMSLNIKIKQNGQKENTIESYGNNEMAIYTSKHCKGEVLHRDMQAQLVAGMTLMEHQVQEQEEAGLGKNYVNISIDHMHELGKKRGFIKLSADGKAMAITDETGVIGSVFTKQ
ncbi:MAG: hypothetical protein Q4B82_08230 [Alysiella sp.]|uniref:hypothetical protein n=1 Tax=Alysiella sp. TaxID=1872483 RepID=UPI0026DA986F|nr:hypothetical protein [Alysiella sp.]MDO4434548.1 hypothetical protein [Alysiella sp.]